MNSTAIKKVRFHIPHETPIVKHSFNIKKLYYSFNKKLDYFSYFIFCI